MPVVHELIYMVMARSLKLHYSLDLRNTLGPQRVCQLFVHLWATGTSCFTEWSVLTGISFTAGHAMQICFMIRTE